MQNFDVFRLESLFLFSTLLKVLRQDIGSSVSFALTTIDLEVVTREFLSPADLFGAQTLHVHELLEVFMVDKYADFMSRAF